MTALSLRTPLRVPVTATLALMCLALSCLAMVGSSATSLADALAWQRPALLHGALWRLWSGQLVHYGAIQSLWDIAAFVLVGSVAERELGSRFTWIALVLGMPAIGLSLLVLAPGMMQYRGISAMTLLLGTAAVTAFWHNRPGLRPLLALLVGAALLRIGLDAAGFSLGSSLPGGVRVAWQAHALGALGGWLLARRRLRN